MTMFATETVSRFETLTAICAVGGHSGRELDSAAFVRNVRDIVGPHGRQVAEFLAQLSGVPSNEFLERIEAYKTETGPTRVFLDNLDTLLSLPCSPDGSARFSFVEGGQLDQLAMWLPLRETIFGLVASALRSRLEAGVDAIADELPIVELTAAISRMVPPSFPSVLVREAIVHAALDMIFSNADVEEPYAKAAKALATALREQVPRLFRGDER